MSYSVKEIYYTIQGEGLHAGRPAVFCRFSGCNLWTGREEDRSKAICQFCDTDFRGTDGVGGGKFDTPGRLAEAVEAAWRGAGKYGRFVVFTGGEPLLQLDENIVLAMHDKGFETAVETNGTLPVPPGIDHVCVSPKAGAPIVVTSGDELKLVYPQANLLPSGFELLDFRHFFLQPMDSPSLDSNIELAVEYCKRNPRWRLSLQLHKTIGIP